MSNGQQEGDFWGVERRPDPAKPLTTSDGDQPTDSVWKKPEPAAKPKRRKWVWIGGGLLGLAAVTLAAAPTIAGLLTPSMINSLAGTKGKIQIENASFGWIGGQKIGTTKILDPDGKEVATLTLSVRNGLLTILSGGLDLGSVEIAGKANIVRYADGTTNLDRALAPAKQAESKSSTASAKQSKPAVPSGLNVQLESKGLEVSYEDRSQPGLSVSIKNFSIVADAQAGKPLSATLSGKATAADGSSGDFKATIKADNWSEKNGTLTAASAPQNTKLELTIDVAGVPTSLLDAIAANGGMFGRALGKSVDLRVDAKGSLKQADATLDFKSEGAVAKAKLQAKDNIIESVGPMTGSIKGSALAALVPAAADLTKPKPDQSATLAAVPDVSFSVDKLRAKLPDDKGLDLRGVSAEVTLGTGAMSGTVASGSKTSAFAVTPATITIATADLAKGATVKVGTTATIDGKPAGAVDVDLALSGLLDANGKPIAGLPGGIEGKAIAKGIATAIAQPFLAGLPIDLPNDAGPVLDVELLAKSMPGGAGSGNKLPPAEIDLRVKGDRLSAAGQLYWASTDAGGMLRTRGNGFTADVSTAGQIAQRALGKDAAWAVSPAGQVSLAVKDFELPLTADFKPQASKAAGQIDIRAAGWTVRPISKDDNRGGTLAQPVQVQNLTTGITLTPGKPVAWTTRGTMNYDSQPFTVNASLRAPGLLTDDPSKPINTDVLLGVLGDVDAKDVPVSIAKFAAKPGEKDDLSGLIRDAVGPAVSVKLTAAESSGGVNQAQASLQSANLNANATLGLSKSALEVRAAKATTTVTPGLQRTLLARFAPDAKDIPSLAAPASFEASIDPITIPMRGLSPDVTAATGTVTANLAASDAVMFEGIKLPAENGKPARSLGKVGVRGLIAQATMPAQVALGAKGSRGVLKASVKGAAIRNAGEQVGTINAQLEGDVAEYAPAGTMKLDAAVTRLAAAFVDELAGQPGLVSGAVGDTVSLTAKARATPVGGDFAKGTFVVDAEIDAPRVKTDKPLHIDAASDRLTVTDGAVVTWTPDAAWLGKYMSSPAEPGSPQAAQGGAKVTRISPVEVRLNKAVLSRGADAAGKAFGPFKQGVFDLDLTTTISQVELSASDGSTTKLSGATVKASREGNGLVFSTAVAEVASQVRGGAGKSVKDVRLSGKIEELADALGAISPATLRVTAKGEIPTLPTQLVDTLADQKGLLVDLLGPETSVKVDADRFGQSGGSLSLLASSERAVVDLSGVVANKAFVGSAQKPGTAKVMVITPQLSKRVTSVMAQFASFEKRADQEPAMVTLGGLKLPLGEEAKKFDADVRIDPGVLNFELDPSIKGIMEAAGQKTQGRLGDKLGPLDITIRQGKGLVKPWTVPLGEFKLVIEGEFDLVGENVNLVMWAPAGAIGAKGLSKAGGALGGIGGDLLGKLAVGIRTTGSMGNPQHRLDAGLLRNPDGTRFKPEDLLKKGLEDLLKPKK